MCFWTAWQKQGLGEMADSRLLVLEDRVDLDKMRTGSVFVLSNVLIFPQESKIYDIAFATSQKKLDLGGNIFEISVLEAESLAEAYKEMILKNINSHGFLSRFMARYPELKSEHPAFFVLEGNSLNSKGYDISSSDLLKQHCSNAEWRRIKDYLD